MAHKVICTLCKEQFDRDKEPFIKVSSTRYAHATCAKEHGSKEQQAEAEAAIANQDTQVKDLNDLEEYIMQLLAINRINERIHKQIKDFHEKNNYTYSGILKSLKYFYEVRGNSTEKANGGIGIVPFVYEDARKYFFQIWTAQQTNAAKPIEQFSAPEDRIIMIHEPRATLRTRRTLFSFLDQEGEDN